MYGAWVRPRSPPRHPRQRPPPRSRTALPLLAGCGNNPAPPQTGERLRSAPFSLRPPPTASGRPTGFGNLPRDVLVKIFRYFSEKEVASCLAPVCRTWRQASKHPDIWRHLSFSGDQVDPAVICRLLRAAPHLESLRLEGVSAAATVIRQLCRCNVNVKHVTVRYCTFGEQEIVPESVFRNLIASCSKIITLDLQGTQFNAFSFYKDLIYLRNLRSLNIGDIRFLKVEDLLTVAINCHGLRELKVARRVTRGCLQRPLTDSDAAYIFRYLTSLLALKFDMSGLGEAALQAIMGCSQLERLELLNALLLPGEALRHLGSAFPHLTSLSLRNACQVTSRDFCHLFRKQNHAMCKLQKLDLCGCWRLGDAGLRAMVDACGPSLQYLSVKCCKSLSVDSLRYIVAHCPRLRYLNVAHALDVPESCLNDIPRRLPDLQRLVVKLDANKERMLHDLKAKMNYLSISESFSEYSHKVIRLEA